MEKDFRAKLYSVQNIVNFTQNNVSRQDLMNLFHLLDEPKFILKREANSEKTTIFPKNETFDLENGGVYEIVHYGKLRNIFCSNRRSNSIF